jgi:acetyl esterase/lipase
MAAAGRRELDIRNGNANPAPDDAQLTQVLQMGIADAQAALRLVRSQAQQWHVDPSRVGMLGFSAGGGVMLGAALAPDKTDASPDFLIALYGPSLMDVNPPPHAPPLFIAVGSAHFNVTNGSIALFQQWKGAGKSAELHVYDGVTGGFNMTPQGRPVDGWPDRVFEWLVAQRFTTP